MMMGRSTWFGRVSVFTLMVAPAVLLLSTSTVTYGGELAGHPLALVTPSGPNNGAWTGTSPFDTGAGINGYIEWAVFGQFDFPYTGYTPSSGYLTYALQVFSTGSESIHSLTINNGYLIEDIGSFSDLPGQSPASFSLGNHPNWSFSGLHAGDNSAGLAFTALWEPASLFGVLLNDFGFALAVPLPIPGPTGLGDSPRSMPGYVGAKYFNVEDADINHLADVSYAVYEPGAFDLIYPGQDPSGGSDYVYTYQITGAGSGISTFTVGLDGNESLGSVGFISEGSVVDPIDALFVGDAPTSVAWDFVPGTLVDEATSALLFFTSPNPPEADTATLVAGLADTRKLPSPTPEPSTLGLLAVGLAGGVRSRRQSTRTVE